MSNYVYFIHQQQALGNRFNIESQDGYTVTGLSDWQNLISRLLHFLFPELRRTNETEQAIRSKTLDELLEANSGNNSLQNRESINLERIPTEELIATLLLFRLRYSYTTFPENRCPRLFISHRQINENYALRIAQLAERQKFAYWVDVLDPNLQILQRPGVSAYLLPLVTACTIEMALINCTHVIACMTPETRGSLWLPYEYGRVTELPGKSKKATAWLHPNIAQKDFPEYMLLGDFFRRESEIENWLRGELGLWKRDHCNAAGGDYLQREKINQLPTEADEEEEQMKREFENWLDAGIPLLRNLTFQNFRIKSKRDKPI